MNWIIGISIGIVLATIISLIWTFYYSKKKYSKELYKDYKGTVINQLLRQSNDYFEDQKVKIQEKLNQVEKDCEQKKLVYLNKIESLNQEYNEAAARHKERIEGLENELVQTINNQSKREAEALASIQDYYIGEKLRITNEFEDFSDKIHQEKAELHIELERERQKQKEIIEQYRKAEELNKNRDFYRIKISDIEKEDIKKLKNLSISFSKPEVLLKLIYETYYKVKLEELFKRVLGDNKEAAGIYKITNINNNKVYIGKTTNLLSRFRTHAKRGTGIERISGLLYDAMYEEGLENFTWEVVLICSKDELSQKEKEMIDFYQSSSYGYNQRNG